MTAGDGRGTTYHLNRLANTLINDLPQYEQQGAVAIWCANNGLSAGGGGKLGNLNLLYAKRNGGKNYNWDTPGVLNGLAGTWGLGEAEAAAPRRRGDRRPPAGPEEVQDRSGPAVSHPVGNTLARHMRAFTHLDSGVRPWFVRRVGSR